jgi:hypothetical protein
VEENPKLIEQEDGLIRDILSTTKGHDDGSRRSSPAYT